MTNDVETPRYFYREIDGREYRARVIGVDPDFGFPLTENRWELCDGED